MYIYIYIYSDRPLSIIFCAFLYFFIAYFNVNLLEKNKSTFLLKFTTGSNIFVQTVLAVFSGVDRLWQD